MATRSVGRGPALVSPHLQHPPAHSSLPSQRPPGPPPAHSPVPPALGWAAEKKGSNTALAAVRLAGAGALGREASMFNNTVLFQGARKLRPAHDRTSGLEAATLQQQASQCAAGSGGAALATARRRQRLVRSNSAAAAVEAPSSRTSHPDESSRAASSDPMPTPSERRQSRQRRLSAQEEQDLATAVAEGGEGAVAAAALLVDANRPLVTYLSRRFLGRGLARQDLVSEGMMALERAALRYRPGHDARFATYAATAIWQAMQRAVHNQSRDVRLPAHHYYDMSRVRQATKQLAAELHGRPSCEQIAERCGFTVQHTWHLLRAMFSGTPGAGGMASLHTKFADGPADTSDLMDDVGDEEQGMLEEQEEQTQAAVVALSDGLERLGTKRALIVALRWGLVDGKTHTFAEIGKRWDRTGSWASAEYRTAERQLQAIMRGPEAALGPRRQPRAPKAQAQAPLPADRATAAKSHLIAAVQRLSGQEAQLLALRWGWADGHKCTYKQVGETLGCSATWASVHYKRAEAKLQEELPAELAGQASFLLAQAASGQQQWWLALQQGRLLQQEQQQQQQQAEQEELEPQEQQEVPLPAGLSPALAAASSSSPAAQGAGSSSVVPASGNTAAFKQQLPAAKRAAGRRVASVRGKPLRAIPRPPAKQQRRASDIEHLMWEQLAQQVAAHKGATQQPARQLAAC